MVKFEKVINKRGVAIEGGSIGYGLNTCLSYYNTTDDKGFSRALICESDGGSGDGNGVEDRSERCYGQYEDKTRIKTNLKI